MAYKFSKIKCRNETDKTWRLRLKSDHFQYLLSIIVHKKRKIAEDIPCYMDSSTSSKVSVSTGYDKDKGVGHVSPKSSNFLRYLKNKNFTLASKETFVALT